MMPTKTPIKSFKKRILFFSLLISLIVSFNYSCSRKKACTGDSDCDVCTDCSRCKHCNRDGGTCGVCE